MAFIVALFPKVVSKKTGEFLKAKNKKVWLIFQCK